MIDFIFIVFSVISFILIIASVYIKNHYKSDKISATLAVIAIIPEAIALLLVVINLILGG